MTFYDRKISRDEDDKLRKMMKMKMGWNRTLATRMLCQPKEIGGCGLTETENTSFLRKIRQMIKEWRENTELSRISLVSITRLEMEIGIKIERCIEHNLKIDHVSAGWWKEIVSFCIEHKTHADIFEITKML